MFAQADLEILKALVNNIYFYCLSFGSLRDLFDPCNEEGHRLICRNVLACLRKFSYSFNCSLIWEICDFWTSDAMCSSAYQTTQLKKRELLNSRNVKLTWSFPRDCFNNTSFSRDWESSCSMLAGIEDYDCNHWIMRGFNTSGNECILIFCELLLPGKLLKPIRLFVADQIEEGIDELNRYIVG